VARARRQSAAEKVRQYPRVSRDAARLAAAVGVLFESREDEDVTLAEIWNAIDDVVPRSELRAALESIAALTPAPQADPGGEWRGLLVDRYAVVRKFVPLLVATIDFGASAEAAPVLDALRDLPDLIDTRATRRVPAGYLDEDLVAVDVVPAGWWQRLVMASERPVGTVDRASYVFCVLEQFHQRLRGRDIYATASSRWTDPGARLLSGPAWEAARGPVLNALELPSDPDELLADLARNLDDAWRHVAGELDAAESAVSIDGEGRLHVASLDAIPDPPSLSALRPQLEAMVPRVDIGELILEVMSWLPGFVAAFTAASGGESRLADLDVTIAAALTAHALNIGYTPVISPGVPALTRARISHVDQNYLRADTYAGANVPLIEAQADIALARALAGWSPASTGFASSYRCRASTPGRTRSTSDVGAARRG
jgi:hypothetical protein